MQVKTALVTGASAGLGRELARQLARDRGVTVLATARREDRLRELAAEFPDGRILVEAGDLADPAFRERLWTRAEGLPGGCDILINNAGLGHYAEFADQDPEAIRRIFEVNVFALSDLTQRAARHMIARGRGQICEVSSVLGFVGLPCSAAYVASKHAVNGLVRSLRYELRGTGVRVWAACPNRTVSEFSSVALGESPEAGRGPWGEPTDRVARAILQGIDRRATFWLPTFAAWAVVFASKWAGWPYERFMERWAPGHFRREIARASRRDPA